MILRKKYRRRSTLLNIKLIAGLGNPGPKYELTRHNAGFLAVDHIVDSLNFRLEKSGNADIFSKNINNTRIYIVKPLTYMNLSGEPLQRIINFYKIDICDILVIHDDIELDPGQIRIKFDSGHGGHNGIRSIIQSIGTKKFYRLKLGVGKNTTYEIHNWVLSRFCDDDIKKISSRFSDITKIIEHFIQNSDLSKMMNTFNRKKNLEL